MVYLLHGGKVHPNFENRKKIFGEKNFSLHYDQKNALIPLVKSVFKSVDNREIFAILSPLCLVFPIGRNAASTTRCVGRYFALGKTCPVQLFKPPPPVGAGGGYMFSGRPSVRQ